MYQFYNSEIELKKKFLKLMFQNIILMIMIIFFISLKNKASKYNSKYLINKRHKKIII